MNINSSLLNKIENGTQVGKVFSFRINNETYWSSVGLQKLEGKYKVYIDEILKSQMASEEYSKEEIREFELIVDAIDFIEKNSNVTINDLTPCKGQKVFNPRFS